eukprot:m51a1_g6121 putative serine threonine kinase (1028) ;mRNA; f:149691-154461
MATPYNWSATPCKLLARNATAHPPDGMLVVGILYSVQLPITLEARALGTVMSVCMAITQAHEAHELGRYNVSVVLFDDQDLSSTSPALSDKAKYPRFMRTCSSVALSSLAMVKMFSKYGITRVAGIGNNDSYAQGGLQKLAVYGARATPPVHVGDLVYYPVDTKHPPSFYGPYLATFKDAPPEAIVLYCASMTCLPLLEQARVMGMLQKPYAWVMGDSITTFPTLSSIAKLYPLLAEAIANDTIVMGVSTAVERNNVTDKYTTDMLEYLKEVELQNPFWGMLEYDAGLAWVHAAKKIIAAGQDPYNRSLFYSTLISLEYQGATGAISFDENGDRFSTNAIFRWVAGNEHLATIGNWTVGGGLVIDPVYAPWAQWRGTDVAAKVVPIRENEVIDEEKLLQEVTIMREALTIVTEFMPRGSLLDVLDVAAGMAYLHGSSPPVIHCDLKSSNILVRCPSPIDRLSASMQAKVCDFGLTVIAHKHGSAATQRDDTVLGSLLWSAPETISSGVFTTKSDVYAFSIVLWETVTRELPYRDTNPVLVGVNVAERNSRPEVGRQFESVQPLRELMERCWDASPDARPETQYIQQSTELWEWDAQLMKEALYQHNDAMRAALRHHKGYEVMTQGDAFMIAFPATADALRFCVDAQLSLAKLRWNPSLLEFPACKCVMSGDVVQFRGLRVRMGIHYGQLEASRTHTDQNATSFTSAMMEQCCSTQGSIIDYFGPCVHKAMRVASSAKGGQLVLSSAAAQFVQKEHDALAELGKLNLIGSVQLQGIAQPEDLFEFTIAGLERHVWRSQAVAVKKFFRQKVDTVTMAEIEHQIKEISQIRHPNIVLFLGACVEPHNMFVVTEWMDMGSLQQLIASSHQLEKQQGIAILASTCSALMFLHQSRILHRDLKSSNILLGKNMEVKVSDFGMAAVKMVNKTSTLSGSIAWVAPEVLGSATYSEASDVYSFGIIMNEILTCEIPFKNLNKIAVVREVLQGQRPGFPKQLGSYSTNYVDLMCSCWNHIPNGRPSFKAISEKLAVI